MIGEQATVPLLRLAAQDPLGPQAAPAVGAESASARAAVRWTLLLTAVSANWMRWVRMWILPSRPKCADSPASTPCIRRDCQAALLLHRLRPQMAVRQLPLAGLQQSLPRTNDSWTFLLFASTRSMPDSPLSVLSCSMRVCSFFCTVLLCVCLLGFHLLSLLCASRLLFKMLFFACLQSSCVLYICFAATLVVFGFVNNALFSCD